ncbi:Protein spinster-like protein 1 [Microtus ochrogaster]|uniref:Protein spinster-like protein 1 n=1 Tax=Microtus ochrogaster TaxID=79684 RepID=A0A8J6L2N5_MICOH|nr:Protein spinster-like protein 1 [Microtus ochrogaster]
MRSDPCWTLSAEVFQSVLFHLMGNAGRPYIIGLISDCVRDALLLLVQVLGPILLICAVSLCFPGTFSGASFRGTTSSIEGDGCWTQAWVAEPVTRNAVLQ